MTGWIEEMNERIGYDSSENRSLFDDVEPEYSLPRDYISVSQVKKWLRCGKQYEFYYIQGKRGEYSSVLARGSIVHAIADRLHQHKIGWTNRMPPEDLKDEIIHEEIQKEAPKVEKWDDKVPDEEALIEDSKALANMYYEEVLPDVNPRFSEQKVQTVLNGRIPFLGYIDLIEVTEKSKDKKVDPEPNVDALSADLIPAGDAVRDLKVTSRKKSQNDADDSMQLTMYSQLVELDDVGFRNLVQTKAGNRKAHHITSKRPEGEKIHAVNVIEDVASAISQGFFPKTNPSDWMCDKDYCPFFEQCRGKHLQVANPDDAACMSGDDNNNSNEGEDDD